MKTYKNLYEQIISLSNLITAHKKAKKGKTNKKYVKEFEENIAYNLKVLHDELKNTNYSPKSLKTFILRDPKTRKISKSAFRDRIVHHALCNIIEPIFDKSFIFDSCANRKGKGTFLAIKRFDRFQKKGTSNFSKQGFCFKADIKHYFREVDRKLLLKIISKKIKCENTLNLIKIILNNFNSKKGMPLGNLTSQFFANVYLNELDKFVKHKLKAKYYVRYVDDFIILNPSKKQLEVWEEEIKIFLKGNLKLELHKDKSKIHSLSKGVDFVGFRNFYYFRLLRKRNINTIKSKIKLFNKGKILEEKFSEMLQGWSAYANWANSYNYIKKINFSLSTRFINGREHTQLHEK
ncbi:MAG: reverse transcriptase domain-containing protein [Nanoarchaeota archaeon]|nr:reverse transcriptase domain-containing protein [Nanoarchaeota archaeon]